jgi:O-antigen ligase
MYGAGQLFSDPNDFALNLCIVLPICVALVLSARTPMARIFWVVAIGLILFAIISTSSRGGFLALIAVTIAMWRQFRIRARTALVITFVVMSFASVAIFIHGASSFYERMITIVTPSRDENGSAQARKELLIKSAKLTLQHPLFGLGPGQFMEASGSWHVTHNSYTQLSSEGGIPSLVLFLLLLRLTLKEFRTVKLEGTNREMRHLISALHCAMYGYLVGAFFLSTAYWFVPYLVMAYTSAACSIVRQAPIVKDDPHAERRFRDMTRRLPHVAS